MTFKMSRDTNAEIVARSSLPKEEPRNAESQKMSKSEQRKQKQIAKHKAMKAQREEVGLDFYHAMSQIILVLACRWLQITSAFSE